MAIEFEVKVRRPFALDDLLARANVHLGGLGARGLRRSDHLAHVRWGEAEQNCVVSFENVDVILMCHKAGEEADLGEEGGFWLTVAADRDRTGAGVLLAIILAIAVAEEVGGQVVDEVGLLLPERHVPPDRLLAKLEEVVGRGQVAELAARLAGELGLADAV